MIGAAPQRPGTWTGRVALRAGLGVFQGHAGDNQPHRHWAHQVSIGIDGPVRLDVGDDLREAPALFVRAGTRHRLLGGPVLSCYLDPTSVQAQMLDQMLAAHGPIQVLPEALSDRLRAAFAPQLAMREVLARVGALLDSRPTQDATPAAEARLGRVLQALDDNPPGMPGLRLRDLAMLSGQSESRFSHWFRERTGMPLRSYRKWLRLVRGVDAVLQGERLTDAAYAAGFADQAHFTRTFVQMFGATPSAVLGCLNAIGTTPHHHGPNP